LRSFDAESLLVNVSVHDLKLLSANIRYCVRLFWGAAALTSVDPLFGIRRDLQACRCGQPEFLHRQRTNERTDGFVDAYISFKN
jgi:hypothetical protein